MKIELPYGDNTIAAELPDDAQLAVLDIDDAEPLDNLPRQLLNQIENPIGLDKSMLHPVNPEDTVCIIVSDSFRHTAIDQLLPTLIESLNARGVSDSHITFLFATGVHRPPTPDEQKTILGLEIFERFQTRLVNHDPHNAADIIPLGTTHRGTQVAMNRHAIECDHLIATGTVVLHYFGGFGGGRKSIVPGIAAVETIAHNHALNLHPTEDRLDPNVRIGTMQGNPVAEDMMEAADFVDTLGIVNTVLNRQGEIAGLFVGELHAAHEAACTYAAQLYRVPIDEPADLVIAASSHTRTFVQTHKALYNAASACAPHGHIVLAAPCPEGLGGETFTKWLELGDTSAIIAALRKNSEINGQTALSTVEKAARTSFLTELSKTDIHRLGGTKHPTLQSAIDHALSALPRSISPVRIALMPAAAYTVPIEECVFVAQSQP